MTTTAPAATETPTTPGPSLAEAVGVLLIAVKSCPVCDHRGINDACPSCGGTSYVISHPAGPLAVPNLRAALAAEAERDRLQRHALRELRAELASAAAALETLATPGAFATTEDLRGYATIHAEASRALLAELAITPYDRRPKDAEPGAAR